MLDNEYLYDTNNVPEIPNSIIEERITLLNINLERLLAVHYTIRDTARVNSVIKAINFWKTISKGATNE